MFLEDRLFLNKSRTRWLSIGALPGSGKQFTAVVRLCESDTKYVTFTRDQIPYLFDILDKNQNYFDPEIETSDKWWRSIVDEAPLELSSIYFKTREKPHGIIFHIGNNNFGYGNTYPFFIILGEASMQNLYDRNKLVWKMVNEVKTTYVRSIFIDLIHDAKFIKDTISEHLIWKAFLEEEAIRFCGTNPKNTAIARDAFTHGFEYFKYHLQLARDEENSAEEDIEMSP